jgi:hypothetical protein
MDVPVDARRVTNVALAAIPDPVTPGVMNVPG